MNKLISFIKKEAVLTIAFVVALISALFVPPDAEYIGYMNFSVLVILFCLMLVVAGFQSAGLFDVFTNRIYARLRTEKSLIIFMTIVCFVSSALVTNDIALITFVPFTLALLCRSDARTLIFAVTAQTVAANLGSLITPIGNPQNLFLYTHYEMSPGEFFSITFPLGAICAAMVAVLFLFCKSGRILNAPEKIKTEVNRKEIIIYSILFILCILSVFKVISYPVLLIIVTAVVLLISRRLFLKVDYSLLATFICFFVFVGNISRIEAVYDFVSKVLEDRELVFSALISQVISNVPAATMLASFTDDAESLILGTNIGGLGTLIASMASLISYRQICRIGAVKASTYIMYFTAVNFVMLAALLVLYCFII